MFGHTENGIPVRDSEGNMRMREGFIPGGINCDPFSYDKDCEMVNALLSEIENLLLQQA